jgi:hypothetical protein
MGINQLVLIIMQILANTLFSFLLALKAMKYFKEQSAGITGWLMLKLAIFTILWCGVPVTPVK